jgi:Mg-chelatase subunit ChlD
MKTEIIVVADESGSMHALKDDANGAFSNFLSEQKDVPGEARVTLVKFNSIVTTVYQGIEVKSAAKLDLKPTGNTALYDAIGMTMNTQRDRIAAEKWADLVIFVVSTDGQENSSREFTLAGVKSMITMAEANGWKFIWLMSNQDAMESARNLGSMSMHTMSKAATGTGEAQSYSYASVETRNLRTEMHKDKL